MHRFLSAFLLVVAVFLTTLAGCNRGTDQSKGSDLKVALVAQPVKQKVADFVDYTGRTNAMVSVVIQARVQGYLTKMPFEEGANVKKDDVLFEIDDRPYVGTLNAATAQLKAAESQLAAAEEQKIANEAKLKFDKIVYESNKSANEKIKGTVPEVKMAEYEYNVNQSNANVKLAEANKKIAEANVDLAKANLQQPTLNLEWTKVRSPIDGHISRYYLTLGNLVNQDSTQLTTVNSIDPMYVYFDMDEPTLLRIKQAAHEGKIRSGSEDRLPSYGTFVGVVGNLGFRQALGPLAAASSFVTKSADAPVYIALQGEENFINPETKKPRHPGTINFIDNTINAGTDSIQVRGIFENPLLNGGNRLLVPGMFVRVRLPIGQEQDQLLVNDRAIISEQGQKKIRIVNKDNIVEDRIVVLGPLLDSGLRVVSGKNFSEDDWVLYTNLQELSNKMEVIPERRTMPELGKPALPVSEAKKK